MQSIGDDIMSYIESELKFLLKEKILHLYTDI